MKLDKLFNQFTKDIFNEKGNNYFFSKFEDSTILANKFQLFIIDNKNWIFNEDILNTKRVHETNSFKSLLDEVSKSNKATEDVVKIDKLVKGKKSELLVIKNENTTVYVDAKLTKYFDNPTYNITKYNGLVYVFESEKLVGAILPVVF